MLFGPENVQFGIFLRLNSMKSTLQDAISRLERILSVQNSRKFNNKKTFSANQDLRLLWLTITNQHTRVRGQLQLLVLIKFSYKEKVINVQLSGSLYWLK